MAVLLPSEVGKEAYMKVYWDDMYFHVTRSCFVIYLISVYNRIAIADSSRWLYVHFIYIRVALRLIVEQSLPRALIPVRISSARKGGICLKYPA